MADVEGTVLPEDAQCEVFFGNAMLVKPQKQDHTIHTDIAIKKQSGICIWGQVKDSAGLRVENALVNLIKEVQRSGKPEMVSAAHTVTDCFGFYQFYMNWDEGAVYYVVAAKAAEEARQKERTADFVTVDGL